jgi:hypothetical protein
MTMFYAENKSSEPLRCFNQQIVYVHLPIISTQVIIRGGDAQKLKFKDIFNQNFYECLAEICECFLNFFINKPKSVCNLQCS